MTQIAFGITHGPNGPQMTTMLIPGVSAAPEPSTYESHLETPEGVHVELIYHTNNKVMADRYSDEVAQKSGWKVLENPPEEPEEPASLLVDLFMGWVIVFVIIFFLAMLTMLGSTMFYAADFISRQLSDEVIKYTFAASIIAFPLMCFLSSMAIIIAYFIEKPKSTVDSV